MRTPSKQLIPNGKAERDPSVPIPRRELLNKLRGVREDMRLDGYDSAENMAIETALVAALARDKAR